MQNYSSRIKPTKTLDLIKIQLYAVPQLYTVINYILKNLTCATQA